VLSTKLTSDVLRCSFCQKSHDAVGYMFSSPNTTSPRAYICDECVAVCKTVLEDQERAGAYSPSAKN
jgi:ATP-dependent Clp protease ATP-binding subunit ClpX